MEYIRGPITSCSSAKHSFHPIMKNNACSPKLFGILGPWIPYIYFKERKRSWAFRFLMKRIARIQLLVHYLGNQFCNWKHAAQNLNDQLPFNLRLKKKKKKTPWRFILTNLIEVGKSFHIATLFLFCPGTRPLLANMMD